jgi:putative tricarboxylic transport membrane protein
VVGYLMRKFDYEPAPLVLAFVLGRMAEESIRQSLVISRGSLGVFMERPLAAVFLAATLIVAAASVAMPLLRAATAARRPPVRRESGGGRRNNHAA